MKKQLPPLTVSMIALTACGNRVGLGDKIQDQDLVAYCQSQVACGSELLQDHDLFYCVDEAQDARYKATKIGCEKEFNDLLACTISEAEEQKCRSDYSDYEDWADEMEDQAYDDDDDPCESEQEDYAECENDFMGLDEDSGIYG